MDVYECWKTAQKYEPSVKVCLNFDKLFTSREVSIHSIHGTCVWHYWLTREESRFVPLYFGLNFDRFCQPWPIFMSTKPPFYFGLPPSPFYSLSLTPLGEFLSYLSRRSLGSGTEMLVYFCSFAGDGRFANTGVWNVCSLQSKWILVRKLLDSL